LLVGELQTKGQVGRLLDESQRGLAQLVAATSAKMEADKKAGR
jgi:hypothetical protein